MGKDYFWNINVHNKVLICDSHGSKAALGLPLFNHSDDDALCFSIPQEASLHSLLITRKKNRRPIMNQDVFHLQFDFKKNSICNVFMVVNCGITE